MQTKSRRSNAERTAATRTALIDAARALFVDKGYADTGTPEIVATARVTRGALYHHFADKQALFRAVVEREAAAVADAVDHTADTAATPGAALAAGGDAYFAAMALPGRARLLLLDGPAVLGRAEMDRIDRATSARSLRDGLAAAMAGGSMRPLPLDATTALLSAVFDRAALAISAGAPAAPYRQTVRALLDGVLTTTDG